ncbi:uncharacterized protein LY89DRAFT_378243 [Mollisia scopiformis]|uniref:Uncharacterized protein n=1 Tax=Mollisia scopiformis TaxID=149040 RepID=A0A194XN71_MOLSC|nr:uncharacterized protein LY89DRAFT_378243 [Mollisia scopiformis]KUJ21586.1 hypothetical protein LY89DRAFT_378243 [Mollisia scopiformis]
MQGGRTSCSFLAEMCSCLETSTATTVSKILREVNHITPHPKSLGDVSDIYPVLALFGPPSRLGYTTSYFPTRRGIPMRCHQPAADRQP